MNRPATTLPLPPPPVPGERQLSTAPKALSAEWIISYEAGYQWLVLESSPRFQVDLFLNHISNLIDFREASPGVVIHSTMQAMLISTALRQD